MFSIRRLVGLMSSMFVLILLTACEPPAQSTAAQGSASVPPPPNEPCVVNDPDINASYVGECKDGYAHGQGEARGRDVYIGEFFEGETHDLGTYRWGPTSDWPGHVYVGEWRNGSRTGFGKYSTPTGIENEGEWLDGKAHGVMEIRFPRKETIGKDLNSAGYWDGDTWVLRGFWQEGDFILVCENEQDCWDKWETQLEKHASEERQKEAERRRKVRQLEQAARDLDQRLHDLSEPIERRRAAQEQARQARQQCNAQKTTCLAACPPGSSGYSCRDKCNRIFCL